MTQKKTITPMTVDALIDSGNVPAIISRYVELMLDMEKFRKYLSLNPDIAKALSSLLPTQGEQWSPFTSTTQTKYAPQPNVQEPLGTIHTEVPQTYDFPLNEHIGDAQTYDQYVVGTNNVVDTPPNEHSSRDAVISMLQGYQGIDPNGEVTS
jgi:hypothetical protein